MTQTLLQATALREEAAPSLRWQPLRASDLGLADQIVEHYSALMRTHALRAGMQAARKVLPRRR